MSVDDSLGTLGTQYRGFSKLEKDDSNTWTLDGSSTFAGEALIRSGTLQLDGADRLTGRVDIKRGATLAIKNGDQHIDSLSGEGALELGSTTVTTGSDNSDSFFDGIISGAGGLVKAGSGTQTLGGVNSYSGDTVVQNGSLLLANSNNGSAQLASSVFVNRGALFGGIGHVLGDVSVYNGAILTPGSQGAGTLNVDGDVTLFSGSTLRIGANPNGTSDQLISKGRVSLEGAKLDIVAGQGHWSDKTQYDVLQGGSVDGQFAQIHTNLAFLTPGLTYTGTNVDLRLTRNDVDLASVAETHNQRAVANALASNEYGSLSSEVIGMSAEQARNAFDGLSGEFHAGLRNALLADSHLVRDAVTDRLQNAGRGLNAGDVLQSSGADGVTVWMKGYGNWSNQDGNSNVADTSRNTRGTLIGLDMPLDQTWRAGVFAGKGTTKLKTSRRESKADIDSTTLGAYLGGQWDALNLRLGASQTWNKVDSRRNVQVGAISNHLKADYDADTTQLFAELGYNLQLDGVNLEPFVGLSHVKASTDSFKEKGGDAALRGRSKDSSVTYSNLGLRASAGLGSIADMPLSLNGGLSWQHALNKPDAAQPLELAGYDRFTVKGSPLSRDSALVNVGLQMQVAPQVEASLGYSGQYGNGERQSGVQLGLNWKF